MTRALFTLTAVAVVTAGSACVELTGSTFEGYADRREVRFTVTDVPELNLSTFDGPVDIRAWDRPDVRIVVERRADSREALAQIEVASHQDGNRIVLTTKNGRRDVSSRRFHRWASAGLTVSVPAATNLTVRNGDGSIEISGIAGRLGLYTADGRIYGEALAGEVKAESGDGAVRLAVNGSIEVVTRNGRIEAMGRLSGVRAQTGDGRVVIRADRGSRLAADWDVSSGDGALSLNLPDGFDAQLEAHTDDGNIHLHDGHRSRQLATGSLQWQMGAGGRAIHLRTADGSITVQRF